jgi:hypothetical protein
MVQYSAKKTFPDYSRKEEEKKKDLIMLSRVTKTAN